MKSRKRKRKFTEAVRGDDDVLIEVEKVSQKRRKDVAWSNGVDIDRGTKPGVKFVVTRFDARIDNEPPEILELESGLQCELVAIKASATVKVAPMGSNERWRIGFVQACTGSVSYSTYGEKGSAVWTCPPLKNGQQTMVYDGDGVQYPFYGVDEESVVLQGPCDTYQEVTVSMCDFPTTGSPWCFEESKPNLTKMFRKISFNIWLIARSVTSGQVCVLKGVEWKALSNIHVDPTKPLGERAHIISDPMPKQPRKLRDLTIPPCALMPPCCNDVQALTWWPKHGEPECIITPKYST